MKIAFVALVALLSVVVRPAAAHCDSVEGPVVKAARAALEAGDARPAMAWVKTGDEAAVRVAFEQAVAVRKLGGEARAMADQFFFETVVRLHRAGEGASYTGLKTGPVNPAAAAADRALADGSVDRLAKEVEHGLRERFERARKAPAGRAFVEAYVEFVHYVERVHTAHGH